MLSHDFQVVILGEYILLADQAQLIDLPDTFLAYDLISCLVVSSWIAAWREPQSAKDATDRVLTNASFRTWSQDLQIPSLRELGGGLENGPVASCFCPTVLNKGLSTTSRPRVKDAGSTSHP